MKMHFIMLFGVLYYNPWDILGGKITSQLLRKS